MKKEKVALTDETVKKLMKAESRRKVDNMQQIISKYLYGSEKLLKRIILLFVGSPVMTCQAMGVRLTSGLEESKKEAKIFLDELIYQYKKIHPQFNYGCRYAVKTNAEKQLKKELEENSYAYDIIMEQLEKNKERKQEELKEILGYLSSECSRNNKKGFKKLGFESCTSSAIKKVANSTAIVFMAV